MAKAAKAAAGTRKLDALPDTLDFRDKMYVPTLVEVPPAIDLARYQRHEVPILDQGQEGACTGFGLATVVNYLMRHLAPAAEADDASPHMLYHMAKRYDEWPGEDYEGSSARGAMKAWHKHGAVAAHLVRPNQTEMSRQQSEEALNRPLGAYFRVNHKDLVAMHAAITEVDILFATCTVHSGWLGVRPGSRTIDYAPDKVGGHAFAIVAYDRAGFWIQNSWGPGWGHGGFAHLSYADWLENGTDVWVARLGAPVNLADLSTMATLRTVPRSSESLAQTLLKPHVITLENDGRLRAKGTYGLTPDSLRDLVRNTLSAAVAGWARKRVLLYAHGGLVAEQGALDQAARLRAVATAREVYPISFVWRSDLLTTLGNLLQDAFRRRKDEGILDAAKDFLFDRLDDMIEPIARMLGGKVVWDEMKENATLASTKAAGGARMAASHLIAAREAGDIDEIHLVGHSAGAILMSALAGYLAGRNVPVASLSLWAPASTIADFEMGIRPLVESGTIEAFDLYTLDDASEQDDDCAQIYHKSLLYLVSGALEAVARNPANRRGTPLLGLDRDARTIAPAFWKGQRRWIKAPASPHSTARRHGDFDTDDATLKSTLDRITGLPALAAAPAATVRGAAMAMAVRDAAAPPRRIAAAAVRQALNKVLRA